MLSTHWCFYCIFKVVFTSSYVSNYLLYLFSFVCIFSCSLVWNWSACSLRISVHPISVITKVRHCCPEKIFPLSYTNFLVFSSSVLAICVGFLPRYFRIKTFNTWLSYLILYKYMLVLTYTQLILVPPSLWHTFSLLRHWHVNGIEPMFVLFLNILEVVDQ